MKIPYLPLYKFASAPLAANRLERRAARSWKAKAGAAGPWDAAKKAFTAEVHRSLYASQSNGLVERITRFTGTGSTKLPQTYANPQPQELTPAEQRRRNNPLARGAMACTQAAGFATLTAVGLICEIAAAVGLTGRYILAAGAVVAGVALGLVRGEQARKGWYRTTTLQPGSKDEVRKLQATLSSYFQADEKWPPEWETLCGAQVTHQFVADAERSSNVYVAQTPEDACPALLECLTVPVGEEDPREDTAEARSQVALNKLQRLCDGDMDWVAHLTAVVTQSLGNAPLNALYDDNRLHHGGRAVRLVGQPRQRHLLAARNSRTLVLKGSLVWAKGLRLMDVETGDLIQGAKTSSSLRYAYRLTLKRPHSMNDLPQVRLEAAKWRLGPSDAAGGVAVIPHRFTGFGVPGSGLNEKRKVWPLPAIVSKDSLQLSPSPSSLNANDCGIEEADDSEAS